MRAIRVAVVVTTVTLLAAATASTSNMAFALRLQLAATGDRLHFVALPYEYAPSTAEALCEDLGGAAIVAEVLRWDEPTSQFVVHPCGTGVQDFDLEEGIAYGVRIAEGEAIDALLVGIHNPALSFTLESTTDSNLTWVSMPYHAAIPDLGGQPGVVDAEDMCRAIGAETVFAIVRWDEAESAYTAHVCGSVFDQPFPLTVGEGYGLVNVDGQEIGWLPTHY